MLVGADANCDHVAGDFLAQADPGVITARNNVRVAVVDVQETLDGRAVEWLEQVNEEDYSGPHRSGKENTDA